jgi:hypothetical protein
VQYADAHPCSCCQINGVARAGNGDGKASEWTWVPGPPLCTARKGFADVSLADGTVVVVGGVDTEGTTLCGAELLAPESECRGRGVAVGARVGILGLVGAAQHNGKEGSVVKYDVGKGRFIVKLDGPDAAVDGAGGGGSDGSKEKEQEKEKPLAVKAENLERLWAWEAADHGIGKGSEADAEAKGQQRAWLPPPMPSARTSFGAVVTTARALGLPPADL